MALTEQKRRYADARLSGMGKKAAAIAAGCPEKSASQAASRYEKDPDVIAAMSRTVAVQKARPVDVPKVDPEPHIPRPSDDPMVFLREMMNDLEAEPRMRLDAAKALLPYVHGKVAEQGKKDQKAEAAKKVGGGRFGTSAPPKLAIDNTR
ncbi:hypothetical protein GCM10022421_32130 [Oceanisphaera sediminis]|uniref:Terminase n=1 Tax=Oceanisphaera sediminis TaxID=981381 RepID=A0ABP7EMT6_9GAMM